MPPAPIPNLFAFGSNGSGQLGIGHDEDVSVPTPCVFTDHTPSPTQTQTQTRDPRVSRIAAGGNHTLVLLDDGRVYAAGMNGDGRCGVNSNSDSNSGSSSSFRFGRVAVVDEGESEGIMYDVFTALAATWEATVLVACSRSHEGGSGGGDVVFVLGTGMKGELGLGADKTQARAGKIRDFPPRGLRVVSAAAGMGHVVVVLSDGTVYGWGASRKGQLGGGLVGEKIVREPGLIEGVPFRVTDAVCGREFTVLCGDREKGEFVVLGSLGDKWGILVGTPATEDVKGYLKMDASWHGVYVHQKDMSVLAWGRNDRGQLPPADLRSAKEVAVGSEHALALLEDRSVVAFGWGEHGNCGPNTDAQGNIKGICNQVPLPEGDFEVIGVGAGCATSWIIAS
ncbi:hypothetical protein ASPVEDRAFT_40718 [Aspergillus versicolor CBS 583.65]|uniref:Alpha-tubulin suppressor protein Aats1 n=1 Tax=Aspergillus versicolor CBS 583.65 TaxID=1036611 RepID=A0A1L9PHY5_ASPVE|nr:uncharacterized protein ASPVEDRAFT_40718 [Aspergillus versicolor CBS 583.65]OJJ01150.1 hypothetical protein ASPVEDRAFT_40718 [Aspergillus versicolor CBS 583.65]